jgi:hypothetical protein
VNNNQSRACLRQAVVAPSMAIDPRRPWRYSQISSRAAAAQGSPARQCREESGAGPSPFGDGTQPRHRIISPRGFLKPILYVAQHPVGWATI